jgi:hypothetical protein
MKKDIIHLHIALMSSGIMEDIWKTSYSASQVFDLLILHNQRATDQGLILAKFVKSVDGR